MAYKVVSMKSPDTQPQTDAPSQQMGKYRVVATPQQQSISPQQPIDQDQSESWMQMLGRVGAGTGASALKSVESIPSTIGSILSLFAPELPQEMLNVPPEELNRYGLQSADQLRLPSERMTERFGAEYLEPRNIGERYVQRLGSLVPFIAAAGLGGGLPAIGGALGRGAIGAIPATLLGEAGAPEWVQDVAQLGTEVGVGLAKGAIPTLKGKQQKAYEAARAAVPEGKKYIAAPIAQSIENVSKTMLNTEVDETIAKKVQHAMDTITKNIKRKKIIPETAMDLRKKLHKLNKTMPQAQRYYISELTDGVNNFFSLYGAENPQFYNALKSGDKLTELKNMSSIIADYISDQFGRLPKIGKYSKDVSQFIFEKTIGAPEKFARKLYKEPIARKHYFDVVKAVGQNSPAMVIKNLNNLFDQSEFEE